MTANAKQKAYAEREKKQNEAIMEELKEWARLGHDPGETIVINPFMLEVQFRTLVEYLDEKGTVERDELNEKFRINFLEQLQMHRANVEKIATRAKITSGIELPPGVTGG